jgi:hypothetical protein
MKHVQRTQRKLASAMLPRSSVTLLFLILALLFALCSNAGGGVFATADSISLLSCYVTTTFSASSIANNTQFVISGCDGRGQGAAFFATMLLITYPAATPPLANISILVQNSVSATVAIDGSSAAPTIYGLSITMRNVTNPASPGPPAGLDCSSSTHPWCLATVYIVRVVVLVALRLSLTNVAMHRNVTNLVRLALWSRASDADIYVANATYSGRNSCVHLGQSGTAVRTNVTLTGISIIVTGVFTVGSIYSMVLVGIGLQLSSATVLLDNIALTDNPALGGSASGGGPIAMLSLSDTFIDGGSVIIIRSSNMDLCSADIGMILYILKTTVSRSQLDVATTQLAARSSTAVYGVSFSSTSVANGSKVRIDTVSVSTAIATAAYNVLASLSDLSASSLTVVGCSFSAVVSGSMVDLAPLTAINSTILVANSSSSTSTSTLSTASIVVPIKDAVLSGVTLSIVNVSCTGGFFAFHLKDSMISNSTITIAASLFLRAYTAMQLDNTTLSDGTSLVLTETRLVVRVYGVVVRSSLVTTDSIVSILRSVTIESATPSSPGVLGFYITGTTVDHSTVIMYMAPSPSFAGRPLSMSAVGFYNSTNVTFDMGPANWTRPSTFDTFLVYFSGNSVVQASTVAIALPAVVERAGADVGAYSTSPPIYMSDCFLADAAVFMLHGPRSDLRTAFQWPSKPVLIFVNNIVVQTQSLWVLDSIFLHNTIAGIALRLDSILVDGPGTEVCVANVSVFVGPSSGARALAVGTMYGMYITSSSIQHFAALRLQFIQCTHDMSQLDTRCVLVDRAVITDGAALMMANFSGPVSSGAVPVTVRYCLFSNASRLVVWADSTVSVNATVSNRSITGLRREGFALLLYGTTIANSSLVAFANSVFSDASVPNTTASLAAALIRGVYLVDVSVINSTVTLPNATFTQCPQQNTTAIELISIADACVFNGSTVSLQHVRTDCGMLLNADNSTAWGAVTAVRLGNVTASLAASSSNSYRPLSLIALGGTVAQDLALHVSGSQLSFHRAVLSLDHLVLATVNSAVQVLFESTTSDTKSFDGHTHVMASTSASVGNVTVTFDRFTLVTPWRGPSSAIICATSTSSLCVALISLPQRTTAAASHSVSLNSVHLVGTTQLVSNNFINRSAAVPNANVASNFVSLCVSCVAWGRHAYSPLQQLVRFEQFAHRVYIDKTIVATSSRQRTTIQCVPQAAIEWHSFTITNSSISKPTPSRSASLTSSPPVPEPTPLVAPPATGIAAASLTATAGALLSGGGGAIGDAASLAALAMITCGGQRTWDSNTGVQRLVISVFYDHGPVASVWGNLGIALFVFAAQLGLVRLIEWRRARAAARRRPSSTLATTLPKPAAVLLRFPSHSNVVFLFLLPGVLFSSAGCFAPTEASSAAVATGVVGIAASVAAVALSVRHAALHVWPEAGIVSTADDFKAALPHWFLGAFGAALPVTAWAPKELKLQASSFFSAMASRETLRLQPLLHVHGAVVALIAGLPFPSSACPAQFAALLVWALVPLVPMCLCRMRVLRRPPSNALSVASSVLAACIVAATAVYFEGAAHLGGGAAVALSVLGYMATVVSGLKVAASLAGLITEKDVRRRLKAMEKAKGHGASVKQGPAAPRRSADAADLLGALWGEDLSSDDSRLDGHRGASRNDGSVTHTPQLHRHSVTSHLSSPVHSFALGERVGAEAGGGARRQMHLSELPLDVQLDVARLDVQICDAMFLRQEGLAAPSAEVVLGHIVQRITLVAICAATSHSSRQ